MELSRTDTSGERSRACRSMEAPTAAGSIALFARIAASLGTMLQVRHNLWLRIARGPYAVRRPPLRRSSWVQGSRIRQQSAGQRIRTHAVDQRWLTMTTRGLPAISPSVKSRPSSTGIPSTSKVRAQSRSLRQGAPNSMPTLSASDRSSAAVGLHTSGRPHHRPCRVDAWKLPDIRKQRLEERATVSPVGLSWSYRGFHHDDVRRFESERHMLECDQTPDEHRRGGDDTTAARFGDDEHLSGATAVAPREPASPLPKRCVDVAS